MKRAAVVVTAVCALAATRAGAPPPVGAFPAALVPDAVTAPLNTKLWAFGRAAPAVDDIGFAVRENDVAVVVTPRALGCCAVVVDSAFAAGSVVDVLVTTAGAERAARFTVGPIADITPPVLTSAGLIDDSGGGLVVGAEGSDDIGLAGFIARHDRVVVAGPVDTALVVANTRCVDVVAVDLAGLESAPQTVCAPDEVVDAGPDDNVDAGPDDDDDDVVDAGPDGDVDDDVDAGSCASGAGGGSLIGLALLFVRRRSRR